MSDVDISVVVTAHNETIVAGPTVLSAEAACRVAEAGGFSVERLIALDAATDACREFFTQPAFDNWTKVSLDQRDLGRTRNAIMSTVKGRWIAFLDADDLFSENWLIEGARRLAGAEARGERIIVHPEFNWIFDRGHSIFVKPDQDDPIFTPYFFYRSNYYDSLCMAPKEAHLEIPYIHRDIPNGLSFQDWQWNIETMAAGWKHVTAHDTIIFKRRRDDSLVTESRNRQSIIRAIEPMAIDRVRDLGKSERKAN
ncbi:glycosyltransferase family 2 protein [Parvibaculum sp.]|uniref:glycosyltransferase family 2 protein n=1 Tax=Parvibaculum sp. TaxID=2024848 RepID=UPI002616D5A3|nr:glycosyltransferase family 2 protein [Parvibaculum sp.]MCW5726858.1 glycosyltransferase family 2 protein [Parvibaculum sp.]